MTNQSETGTQSSMPYTMLKVFLFACLLAAGAWAIPHIGKVIAG